MARQNPFHRSPPVRCAQPPPSHTHRPLLLTTPPAQVSLQFLKTVLLRYMTQGDLDNTLPVIAKALDFTNDEVGAVRRGSQRGGLLRVFKVW